MRLRCATVVGGLLVTVVCGIAIGVFFYLRMEWPPNFGIVVHGVLMRSGQPTPASLANLLRQEGLKMIVNLRGPEKVASDPACLAEEAFARKHGIAFRNIPLSTPPTQMQVDAFLALADDHRNHPILVHCAMGRGRAGAVCAVYGMERLGWSNETALARQLPFGFAQDGHYAPMREFILRYHPKRNHAVLTSSSGKEGTGN